MYLQLQGREFLRSGMKFIFMHSAKHYCISAMKQKSTTTRSEFKTKILWFCSSACEEPRGQGNSRLEVFTLQNMFFRPSGGSATDLS